ncbi:hypothetical protein ASZ90_017560 [hydrocarbon metagenome]|uniref:Uncharacterized protein n=1 Tax=hydrocarbon metagenome TaxID=938273 RepID=A0A0W8E8W4_9ZZZZ
MSGALSDVIIGSLWKIGVNRFTLIRKVNLSPGIGRVFLWVSTNIGKTLPA